MKRLLAVILLFCPLMGFAQSVDQYPSKPIKIMIGFAPGGSTDGPVRILAESASKILNQPIVVENKVGAGGTMPMQILQSVPPDGYTLAISSAGIYRMPYTTDLKWDPVKDISYIIGLTGYSFGIVVPTGSPIKNCQDYVAQAKAKSGLMNYSTPGIATTNHLTMERISRALGISLNHIPYKGSAESLQALLAGQVDSAAETSAWAPQVEAGKMRLLVVWSKNRMKRFPDVPTLKEMGVDLVQSSPWGLVGPKGMDPKIIQKLHHAFKQAMEQQEFKDALAKYDMELDYRNNSDFVKFAADSMKKEKEIIQVLGLNKSQTK